MIILVICFLMTVEINPPSKQVQKSSFLDDLKHIFQNKYYIILLGCAAAPRIRWSCQKTEAIASNCLTYGI